MRRLVVGAVMCLGIAAGVELTGVGRLLPLHRVVPPPVPERRAALPAEGRVDLFLAPSHSEELVSGLAMGLSRAEVALQRPRAIALVDGRVFANSVAAARSILEALSWERLPITERQLDGVDHPIRGPVAGLARLARATRRLHGTAQPPGGSGRHQGRPARVSSRDGRPAPDRPPRRKDRVRARGPAPSGSRRDRRGPLPRRHPRGPDRIQAHRRPSPRSGAILRTQTRAGRAIDWAYVERWARFWNVYDRLASLTGRGRD